MSKQETMPEIETLGVYMLTTRLGARDLKRIAHTLTVEANTQVIADALRERGKLPVGSGDVLLEHLLEAADLGDLAFPTPVTTTVLQDWEAGKVPIPQEFARALLHYAIERECGDFCDDAFDGDTDA